MFYGIFCGGKWQSQLIIVRQVDPFGCYIREMANAFPVGFRSLIDWYVVLFVNWRFDYICICYYAA